MTDKEFMYSMYDQDLVDYAMESTKDFYRESTFEADMKLAEVVENAGGVKKSERLYNHIYSQMVFSFLHGASYAVDANLTSTQPSECNFSEFHKNVDFAVLFNFSDNDFGLAISAGAKAFCDEFNSKLIQIDLYDDCESTKSRYLKEFAELCKIENIKEIMKCGFAAQRLKDSSEVFCGRIPNITTAMQSAQSDLDYIPWDKNKTKWEKIDGNYVESEEFPRFITGTNEFIADELVKHGHLDATPEREFPVWCNGEVVIMYMKNGYLKYVIR